MHSLLRVNRWARSWNQDLHNSPFSMSSQAMGGGSSLNFNQLSCRALSCQLRSSVLKVTMNMLRFCSWIISVRV